MKKLLDHILRPAVFIDRRAQINIVIYSALFIAVLAFVHIPVFIFLFSAPSMAWVRWQLLSVSSACFLAALLAHLDYLWMSSALLNGSLLAILLFNVPINELISRPHGAFFIIPIFVIGFLIGLRAAIVFCVSVILFMILVPFFTSARWTPWTVGNLALNIIAGALFYGVYRLMEQLYKTTAQVRILHEQEVQARRMMRFFQHEMAGYVSGFEGLTPTIRSILHSSFDQHAHGELDHMLVVFDRTVANMSDLIQQLLVLTREGILPPQQQQQIDLQLLCRQAEETLRTLPLRKHQECTIIMNVDIPPGLILLGNPVYLSLAVITALRNSLEAFAWHPTQDTLAITVSARSEDDRILLRIEDTGPGFPHELLVRLATAPRATDGGLLTGWSSKDGGSGLGLALIDRVAHLHNGGRMTCGNLLGRSGAWIQMELPLWNAPRDRELYPEMIYAAINGVSR